MTSNAPEPTYADLLRGYRQTLDRFVGPTELLIYGDTLQLKDYDKTDWPWTMFDPAAKQRRHAAVFPAMRAEAFEKGVRLASGTA